MKTKKHECCLLHIIRDGKGFHLNVLTHEGERSFFFANGTDLAGNVGVHLAEFEKAYQTAPEEDDSCSINTPHVGRA